ncbi:HPF/RaiA family ribosome-associated protein [Spirosoma oryzicola]|uniref:HPF/RaiA family ribosome-associated protein n=1 Tax=Spirosoma oryzicola TaxID=2898794 RepID=UPI001E310C14|nr:HPF/RaiA family ribosome-associated protein [Spirosoma oryzicola]UHG93940.1 HPF/RaiA family ribosome-associated protein [Spirosoma oryzicola]
MESTVDTIKIDLQTVGFDSSPQLAEQVKSELNRLLRFRKDIVAADFYLSEDGSNPQTNKLVRWRLGVPGNDLFAEARTASWSSSLREAGEKLRRQFVD